MLVFYSSFGQYTLSGTISSEAGTPIAGAEVYLTSMGKQTVTDANGFYMIPDVLEGEQYIVVFTFQYDIMEKTIRVEKDTKMDFKLEPLGETLSEVVLTKRKERQFALRKLQPVEGTAIYAGKKSEVVLMDNLTANLATGNARQIYSQVVGLNIYENNDAGLQLNIGGRGLDPNRSANFNIRQNGYDISADVLGYPESYYTPPAEALRQVEVVRGAASLQYGTQFGGLVNFKMKGPNLNKKLELVSRQTLGSFNLFNSFNSLGGTVGEMGYYTYFNYKKGNDFRPNSEFESYNTYAHVDVSLSDNTTLTGEFSYLYYLAQQPGGLTDRQFEEDPSFSNRTRNWFEVDWKLYAMLLEHQFSQDTDASLQLFALDASRKSVGFRENRVSQEDDLDAPRELIVGNFRNWGAEGRVLHRYALFGREQVGLLGAKYYQSNNTSRQGPGTNGSDANFSFAGETYPDYERQSDFTFPNLNLAIFGENIINLSETFSITPGVRFEYIKTESEGTYKNIQFDLAGNPILNETIADNRTFDRKFLLAGIGFSNKSSRALEVYGNVSQNYRSVTFNDIRITNPSLTIDPDISDEKGFTADMGIRGKWNNILSYDIGAFFLQYDDRLGLVLRDISDIETQRFRGNIGDAFIYGLESFMDWDVWKMFSENDDMYVSLFSNLAVTDSEYTASEENNVEGNKVEFIPAINLKTGVRFGIKNFLGSLQYTYLSKQFTDATNSERDFDSQSGIVGEIPAYDIVDLSFSYTYKMFRLETGINNVLDNSYFVRRATGYPGPGIIPSQPRTFYCGLQLTL